jgi:ubiquinone/menaquinone biosynthesis C-methylase UbiE
MTLRKLNWLIIQNLNKIFKTSVFDEIYWRYRSCKGDWGGNTTYAETYDHPHRQDILDILKEEYGGYFTLLEVGCNSGPNIEAIKRVWGLAGVVGTDINPKAIKEARQLNPYIPFYVSKADKIGFPDKSFNVVLADAVLMYVGPDKIQKVAKEMLRVASKQIIIVDFHQDGFPAKGKVELGHWVRDYRELFKGYDVEVRKITNWKSYSWQKLGHIIVVNL